MHYRGHTCRRHNGPQRSSGVYVPVHVHVMIDHAETLLSRRVPSTVYVYCGTLHSSRCVGCFCTRSGGSRCVGHSFGVVEAQRTSANLQETHHHRASTVCRVLLHYFGVVQAPRTYTNHTILTSTELARCEGCFGTSSGWFKHSEPLRTYTNHTITEVARCVGCFCTSSGGSSTANQ